MAVYTPTIENIYGDSDVTLSTTSADFNEFVYGAVAEKAIVLCAVTIWSDNFKQLNSPFTVISRDIDGKEKVDAKVPDISNYAAVKQITDFPLNFYFDGISKIQYLIQATTDVRLTFKFNDKASLTKQLAYSIERDIQEKLQKEADKLKAKELQEPEEIPVKSAKEPEIKGYPEKEPEEIPIAQAKEKEKKEYETQEPEEIPVQTSKEAENKDISEREPEEIPIEIATRPIYEKPEIANLREIEETLIEKGKPEGIKGYGLRELEEIKPTSQKPVTKKEYDIREPDEIKIQNAEKPISQKGWEFGDVFEPEEKIKSVFDKIKTGFQIVPKYSGFKRYPNIDQRLDKKYNGKSVPCMQKDPIAEEKEQVRQKLIDKIKKESKKEAQQAKKVAEEKKKIMPKVTKKPEIPRKEGVPKKLWLMLPILLTIANVYLNYKKNSD